MAYPVFTTEAFVIGSVPVKDADKYFFLITEEFGCIGALAIGVRLEKSKHRYALQEGSRISVSLVRGKQFFRIVNTSLENSFSKLSPLAFRSFLRISAIVRRLVSFEGNEQSLFEIVDMFYEELLYPKHTNAECFALELLATATILERLGYWNKAVESFDTATLPKVLKTVYQQRSFYIEEIEKSLSSSHL